MSIYLLPLSPLAVRPLNRGATSLRSLATLGAFPFLVPCPCCRRCACRTVALDRKVPPAYLPALARAPTPVATENDLPRFIVVCEVGQSVSLGGEVMPRRRCVSRKTVGTCRNVHFLARGSACAHRNFRFLPSPFTYLCKTQ